MKINEVKETYSPSMDIQISSNFEREIFESSDRNSDYINKFMNSFLAQGYENLSKDLVSKIQLVYKTHSVCDSEVLQTIKEFKHKYNYIADPHTATGLNIMNNLDNKIANISLGCAHPAKFSEAINKATDQNPDIPISLKNIFEKKEKMTILENDTNLLKSKIMELI